MLVDLRDERELANSGGGLEVECLEVDRLLAGGADHFDDAGQRLAFGEVAGPGLVHECAEGVVQLHGVDAHMDVRRADARLVEEAR